MQGESPRTKLDQFIDVLSGSVPIEETDLTPEQFAAMSEGARQQMEQVEQSIESGPLAAEIQSQIRRIISELN